MSTSREEEEKQKQPSGFHLGQFKGPAIELLPSVGVQAVASTVQKDSDAVKSIKTKVDLRTMSSLEVCWPVPMRAIGAQNLLTMPGGVSIAGYLHKKGSSQFSLMRWPLRYIIIHKGCVYYFKSSTSPAPQGAFSLNGYNRVMRAAEETTSSNVFPFKMIHFSKKHRTWFFSAASEDERRRWMRSLRWEIDHYNDRKESQIPSDSDSDADSFYGTIERPLDIKHPINNEDAEYGEDDDEDDAEEDYLKPDGDGFPACTSRPTGPPPSYPPPPVPMIPQRHRGSCVDVHKDLPPPVPSHNRFQTSANLRKTPTSMSTPIPKDPNKGPPPPPPFTAQLHNRPCLIPPPLPPPNSQRPLKSRVQSVVGPGPDRKHQRHSSAVSLQSPTNLPICDQLETRMLIMSDFDHCARDAGSLPAPGSNHLTNHRSKPSRPVTNAANFEGPPPKPRMTQIPCGYPPVPCHPPRSPLLQTGLHNQCPKPPPVKPPLPLTKPRQPGTPLQRAAPEGQSFRLSGDKTATELKKKQDLSKCTEGDGSDEDYDDMYLPKSVFIDSTETSFVEKLFKESSIVLQDGLYGIRNSGTKTSKVLVVWDISIGKARNYRLFEEADQVFLDCDVTFPTLSTLIEHYYSHPLPHQGSLCLQKPYSK
ncbi:SH3 domain-binding protein 2 isoform X3 [Hippocampus comes]|uniref:SH3 domain-binding protein 2 isoform X3 n=1 Tax=Hippocampus comes TaxID=109280 RepID=UPI00094E350B|nr:PREDICTED: SH3 domain-binding protein 2 isoform X3 [Hippocampus comes]